MHKLNSIVVLFGLLVLLSALVVCSVLPPPNQQMNHKLVLSLVQPNANNNLSNHKIVGGSTASYAQFPHMVSLRRNDYHFCGGSIISNRWILTAAHCLYGFSYWDILTAVVGTNTLDGFGTVYQVVQQILHEDYSPSTVLNDIALIKVHETIEFTDTVNKIALPLDSPSDNFLATFSGWGLTSYPGSIPNALQYINLLAYDLDTCAQYYHSSVFPIGMGHVCTLNTVNEGICMGDSGGPLIVNGEQIGIASWVAPCALGAPDVFTSVFHYLPWIFDQIDTL